MVSWPSSRTPRSLTTDENRTVAFRNFSVWTVTLSSCWRVPMICVFSSFSLRRLLAIQSRMMTDPRDASCTSSDDQSHQNGRWLVTVWFTTWCSLTTLKQPASAASWCSWDRMIDLLTEHKNYRKIHQAKIHNFLLKGVIRTRNVNARLCMAYARKKTAFLRFINRPIKFKFCFWGLRTQTPTGALPLDPVEGLQSPRPPEIWTHSYKNPAIRPWIYISAICC